MEEGHKIFHFEKADIIPVVRDIVESFQQHTADQGFHINLAFPNLCRMLFLTGKPWNR